MHCDPFEFEGAFGTDIRSERIRHSNPYSKMASSRRLGTRVSEQSVVSNLDILVLKKKHRSTDTVCTPFEFLARRNSTDSLETFG